MYSAYKCIPTYVFLFNVLIAYLEERLIHLSQFDNDRYIVLFEYHISILKVYYT